jgi:hypothetical protein
MVKVKKTEPTKKEDKPMYSNQVLSTLSVLLKPCTYFIIHKMTEPHFTLRENIHTFWKSLHICVHEYLCLWL